MPVPRTCEWIGGATDGRLDVLDQRALPHVRRTLRCETPAEVHEAIRTLAVRGAPAIGVAAAYGVVLGLRASSSKSAADVLAAAAATADFLVTARPTAVNLAWALERMRRAAELGAAKHSSAAGAIQALLAEARAIEEEDVSHCRAIGEHGSRIIPEGGGVLTHCNAGALATAGIGTALGVIYAAKDRGRRFRVYADETRPLLQGARLTAWELREAGVDVTLICDGMAASLMARGAVQVVVVGADRIARNGDVANKIGTYGVACLAHAHGVPFYVAAPSTTFDLSIATGKEIPIEERAPDEVRGFGETSWAPAGVPVWNPAFDVTPARLVAGIITERGVIERPGEATVLEVLGARA